MLDEPKIQRYARQIVLPEIGGSGQERLLASRVLVVGAGGLGCPLVAYLSAAGVGTIGVIDDDIVDVSNLHRQFFYTVRDVGLAKVEALAARCHALNPDCRIVPIKQRIDADNANGLLDGYDLVADGCDNLATRKAVHDAAMRGGMPLVSAAVQGLDGQLTTFRAFDGPPHPCLYCTIGPIVDEGLLPTCAAGGVLGPAAGVIGSLQAVETVKLCLGRDDDLSGKLIMYDANAQDFLNVRLTRQDDCPFCAALDCR